MKSPRVLLLIGFDLSKVFNSIWTQINKIDIGKIYIIPFIRAVPREVQAAL